MDKCRRCGQRIAYIKTYSRTRLAINPEEVYYKQSPGAPNKIVTPNGEMIRCFLLDGDTDDLTDATGYGYIPHNPTCPKSDKYRKDRR